jgi:hypothetical protein
MPLRGIKDTEIPFWCSVMRSRRTSPAKKIICEYNYRELIKGP